MTISHRVALAPRDQYASREGAKVDTFQVHHMAGYWGPGLATLTGSARVVSSTWAIGGGEIVMNVPLDMRPFVSGSGPWDRRSESAEVANSFAGGDWPVADADFHNLARVIADWSERRGVPITDATVITHQELNRRHGVSYATACPGSLQNRKPELLALANTYRTTPITTLTEEEMALGRIVRIAGNGTRCYLLHSNGILDCDTDQKLAIAKTIVDFKDGDAIPVISLAQYNEWGNHVSWGNPAGVFKVLDRHEATLKAIAAKLGVDEE